MEIEKYKCPRCEDFINAFKYAEIKRGTGFTQMVCKCPNCGLKKTETKIKSDDSNHESYSIDLSNSNRKKYTLVWSSGECEIFDYMGSSWYKHIFKNKYIPYNIDVNRLEKILLLK